MSFDAKISLSFGIFSWVLMFCWVSSQIYLFLLHKNSFLASSPKNWVLSEEKLEFWCPWVLSQILTLEHILEPFNFSESVSTFILSWKLSLLCLICSQLSWMCSESKKSGFLPFIAWETQTHFMFPKFWPSGTCPSSFQHLESMKVQIQGYKKTP